MQTFNEQAQRLDAAQVLMSDLRLLIRRDGLSADVMVQLTSIEMLIDGIETSLKFATRAAVRLMNTEDGQAV